MPTRTALVFPPLAALSLTAALAGGDIEVIFTEVPGHATAVVPGAVDLDGKRIVTEFKAMELFSLAPDGSAWIVKGRNTAGSDLETMLLIGSGTEGVMLAQEGQPVHDGVAGEVYEFFGSGPPRFNRLGQYVFTARARGGDSTRKHKGIMYDGAAFHMMRQESDPALGLLDLPPNPSGDELFGNSFGSMHLLDDGTIGYQDSTIKNIHSSRRPAIFYNDTAFLQSGVSGVEEGEWDSFDANRFLTTPDGEVWMAQGDDAGPTANDDVLVVSGQVVLREGSVIPGTAVIVDAISQIHLAVNGDWYARGDDPVDDDWAVVNGALVAGTGTPVVAGSGEQWGNRIVSFSGNATGDWVIAGGTDDKDVNANDVVVLNGKTILAREGDPVDLDGNGRFDDDAFIGRGDPTATAFLGNDIAIGDDGSVYVIAALRNAAGEDLGADGLAGDAFLRIRASGVPCPQDLDGSGDVGFVDLLRVLAAWGPCPGCPEDFDRSGDVGFTDLLATLAAWGPCR
ncbi:MAG: hypothetical protein HKO59_07575 [Phycisphaerales bacterium]|nr:hypothetical protein [Phycisphaerales bacterium]NNM25835.1 hypothetical protein [Phycisphaerales bacterium]